MNEKIDTGNSEFDALMNEIFSKPFPPFKPYAYYNEDGNFLEVVLSPNSYYGKWVMNSRVMHYCDHEDREKIIGMKIQGIKNEKELRELFIADNYISREFDWMLAINRVDYEDIDFINEQK
jgi:hypothetical protein